MRKKAEIDAFPLEVTLGPEPPASLSSDDFTLKGAQRLRSGLTPDAEASSVHTFSRESKLTLKPSWEVLTSEFF